MSANSMNGSGLPIILVDTENRDRRPKELSYSAWIKSIRTVLDETKASFKKFNDIDMTEEEVLAYLAWSMEGSLKRVIWTVDDDQTAMTIILSSAFDHLERYVGYRKGAYPPPQGDRFDSPAAFERWLQSAQQPATEARDDWHGLYL